MATPLGVELLSIVTGPLRMLTSTKPIEPREVVKAADVEGKISRAIRSWLKQEEPSEGAEPPEREYLGTLQLLSKEVPLETRLQTTSLLPPDLGVQYNQQFDRTQKFLRDNIPRRSIITLTGQQMVEPSDLELSTFWRAWEAANDPRALLKDMEQGDLVSDQVAVAKQLYPSTYDAMTLAMIAAIMAEKGRDEEWEPADWQEQQIETLLQISRVSPETMMDLHARLRAADMQDRAESAKTSPLTDKMADQNQTPTQRVALR